MKLGVMISGRSESVSAMYNQVASFRDLPEIMRRQIAHFFERYKDLEDNKWVKISRWGDEAEAREIILKSIEDGKKS